MILSDGWCCYDCVTESGQCAAAARRCIQLLLPGTQGCFTETLRLQLELWNFRYLLIYIKAHLVLSLRTPWAFSEDLSIIGSFPTVHCWNNDDIDYCCSHHLHHLSTDLKKRLTSITTEKGRQVFRSLSGWPIFLISGKSPMKSLSSSKLLWSGKTRDFSFSI